jgi:enoyl-CoA hydratase/carnithine racemase
MGDAFGHIVDELSANPGVAAVIVTGAGRAFSSGGKLNFLQDRAFNSTPEVNTNTMKAFYGRFLLNMRRLPVPTIAAVNGDAIGAAFSFALSADMRVIAEDARLSLNFTQVCVPCPTPLLCIPCLNHHCYVSL